MDLWSNIWAVVFDAVFNSPTKPTATSVEILVLILLAQIIFFRIIDLILAGHGSKDDSAVIL